MKYAICNWQMDVWGDQGSSISRQLSAGGGHDTPSVLRTDGQQETHMQAKQV